METLFLVCITLGVQQSMTRIAKRPSKPGAKPPSSKNEKLIGIYSSCIDEKQYRDSLTAASYIHDKVAEEIFTGKTNRRALRKLGC